MSCVSKPTLLDMLNKNLLKKSHLQIFIHLVLNREYKGWIYIFVSYLDHYMRDIYKIFHVYLSYF
jgi:hypothetical protein